MKQSTVRMASLAHVNALLDLWAPYELNGSANAYVSEADLRAMIGGGATRRAYVIESDDAITGAFTARRYRDETNERIVRIDSIAISDQAVERTLYQWLTNHPAEFNEAAVIDVWLPCTEPGHVAHCGSLMRVPICAWTSHR
jgi:hypothetical protein